MRASVRSRSRRRPEISSGLFERTAAIEQSAKAWKTLLSMEEATFREPGLLDAGEFILARGTRPAELGATIRP
jgi:hypothetical protein